jgi:hypothetical protein
MVPQVACRDVPHLRRARLHATGGVRPCASDGDPDLPGGWESVAPDGASVKGHMMLWRKRFQREWGEPARYIWKLEFQRRGAPHIHLWMAPPHAVRHSVEVVYVERGGCELLRTDWDWPIGELVGCTDGSWRSGHPRAIHRTRQLGHRTRTRDQRRPGLRAIPRLQNYCGCWVRKVAARSGWDGFGTISMSAGLG